MLQEVFQLEKLRQEVEKAAYASGSLSDYLDRGKPTERQAQETLAQIAWYKKQQAELNARLQKALATWQTSNPQVVEQWVQWHQSICQRILAEPNSVPNHQVRQHVAGETLQAWEKVLQGDQETVIINSYYLADYAKEVARVMIRQGRPWWKFWK